VREAVLVETQACRLNPCNSQDLLPKLVELHKHLTEVEGDLITEAEE
jgi:hypothetical protein